ncbi:scavenger receptor cysteine-rich domain-containing protein DMBT1-like [Ptychodera flava]|uniref:scavenger receptor cysteine-rich domain-containing protein DMBT1-like n=1 Tax=Ptychodera flava TaxID=63121 RepID=UPI00396A45C4
MIGHRVQLLAAALTVCVCGVVKTTEIDTNEKNVVDYNEGALHKIERRAIGDCGGSFVDDSGQFSSPGYPNSYSDNANCVYYITVPLGHLVQLVFNPFNTEENYDKVKIYETYPSVTADAEYSGTTLPDVYLSSGSTLTVVFTSDGSSTRQGFLATYTAVTTNQGYTLGDCGGSFTQDSGFFASPLYPFDYPSDQECYYYITVSEGSVVTLEFTIFETERCCDRVEIFDGNTASSTSLGQYSGTSFVPQITSSGRSLVVHFHSDTSVSERGFYATYSTGPGGSDGGSGSTQYSVCDQSTLIDYGGVIQSPNYPLDYPNDRDCSLIITASGVYDRVFVKFVEIDLYHDTYGYCGNSGYDYVRVYDYGSTTLATLCFSYEAGTSYSSSDSITITFHSGTHYGTYKGFQATYALYYTGYSSCYNGDAYLCENSYQCVSSTLRCDDHEHCENGEDEDSCLNVTAIAAGVAGTIVVIVIAIIIVVYCCKQKSSTSPSTNASNRATALTQPKPAEIPTVSISLNGPSPYANSAYAGYYQPAAPAYHNTYNNPTFGQDQGQGYSQPPGLGTAPPESTYPPPLPGSVNDPSYPPQGQPSAMYPPPPQGINPPTPAAYDPMYPPPPQPSTGESNPSAPPPAYDAAVNLNNSGSAQQ